MRLLSALARPVYAVSEMTPASRCAWSLSVWFWRTWTRRSRRSVRSATTRSGFSLSLAAARHIPWSALSSASTAVVWANEAICCPNAPALSFESAVVSSVWWSPDPTIALPRAGAAINTAATNTIIVATTT